MLLGGGSSACLAAMPGHFPLQVSEACRLPSAGTPGSPPGPNTDLSPLQHLPLVQHFHGKICPLSLCLYHSDLRPQRVLGSRRSGGKHLFPPPPTPGPSGLTSPEGPSSITSQDLKVVPLQPQLFHLCYGD